MSKSLYGFHGPLVAAGGSPLRRFAAVTLRHASRGLGRLARRLALQHPTAAMRAPELEFYAESGAPEGALYLDGELVGYLPGVKRL
jgi:hypothetical protein